jgi:hypothetical protein
MEMMQLEIDAQLAKEYCENYRRLFLDSELTKLDDKSLLKAFVEDRLEEELDFIANEMKLLKS